MTCATPTMCWRATPDFIEECYKGEKDFSDANYQKAVTDLARC